MSCGLTDRPDMTLDVYRGRKTTIQLQQLSRKLIHKNSLCRKLFTKHNSLGRKQEITEVSVEAKYDR